MNNILVLTDFSEASFHALLYAAGLTYQFKPKQLILYHAYEVMVPISEAAISLMDNGESLRRESLESLKLLHTKLHGMVFPGTHIASRAEDASLVDSVNDLAEKEDADLVVMGITSKTRLGKLLIGSNAIRVADESKYPVLIVPHDAVIGQVKRIVFVFDLKNLPQIIPAKMLKKVLDDFQAELLVAMVDYKEEKSSLDKAVNAIALQELLDVYHPVIYQIDDPIDGILEFAKKNAVSLIVSISKNHGFFEALFQTDITHKLAWKSPVPRLVIHEK